MEFKKRKADLQLTQENVDEVEASYTESVTKTSTESETKGDDSESAPPAPAAATGGFSAYAKANPFAAAMANNTNKSPFGSTAAPTSFGSASAAGRSSFTMPPPLVLPSPKSPKTNPFSSPSPAHNPFMTIVQNNDDMWKSMANDKLSADEVAKSSGFAESKNRKSPVFRTSFFGGNGNTSFSSVSAANASSGQGATSVFGSSSSGSSNNNATTTSATTITSVFGNTSSTAVGRQGGAEEEEEEEEGGGEDGLDNSPPANHASMKIISLPENVKLVTGEEDDECLLQMRAKIFRLHTNLPSIETPITVTDQPTKTKDNGECSEEVANSKDLSSGSSSSSTTADAGGSLPMEASSVLNAVAQEKNQQKLHPSNKTPTDAGAAAASAGKAGEWVEIGIGPLKILSRKTNSNSSSNGSSGTAAATTGRLVMRREDKQGGLGTKLLLNAWLDRSLTVSKQSDKMVQLVCVNHAEVPLPAPPAGVKVTSTSKIGTYLIKTKTADEAEDICAIVSDFINRAKQAECTINTTNSAVNTSSTTAVTENDSHIDNNNDSIVTEKDNK